MQLKVLACLAMVVALVGCGRSTIEIHYALANPVTQAVFHNATYSTIDSGLEVRGTVIATYANMTWSQQGSDYVLERTWKADKSQGYHKNSMPLELGWRVPRVSMFVTGLHQVTSIRGNEMFQGEVVEKLPIKDQFKRQLRDARIQLNFDREDKHRWELSHLLDGFPVTEDSNYTQVLKDRKAIPLSGGFIIDSVRTITFRKLNGRSCFEYHVYFQERDPFPYFMWEQFAYSTKEGKNYRDFRADSTVYQTDYTVTIDPSNGTPCQERQLKTGVHYISHPETKQQATFKSYVVVEDLYTPPDKD